MRGLGINYDTGFVNAGVSTHEPFEPDAVRRHMRVIRDELHCTAVRITGGHEDRLEIAARHAAAAGLEVWVCPFTCDVGPEDLLELLGRCAGWAESLRREGAEVVVLTGSELSMFVPGFVPGATFLDRVTAFTSGSVALAGVPGPVNAFLARAAAVVRARFGGRIGYASLPFEAVDPAPFDVVCTDAGYRDARNADGFRASVAAFVAAAGGRPAVVTEFGCTTHRGAADKGGHGSEIVEWDGGHPVRLDGDYVRDEDEQARYLREVLQLLDEEGVDSAFVYTFARFDLPHRTGPREDLDLASHGVVKVLDGGWEPKAAFHAVASCYAAGPTPSPRSSCR